MQAQWNLRYNLEGHVRSEASPLGRSSKLWAPKSPDRSSTVASRGALAVVLSGFRGACSLSMGKGLFGGLSTFGESVTEFLGSGEPAQTRADHRQPVQRSSHGVAKADGAPSGPTVCAAGEPKKAKQASQADKGGSPMEKLLKLFTGIASIVSRLRKVPGLESAANLLSGAHSALKKALDGNWDEALAELTKVATSAAELAPKSLKALSKSVPVFNVLVGAWDMSQADDNAKKASARGNHKAAECWALKEICDSVLMGVAAAETLSLTLTLVPGGLVIPPLLGAAIVVLAAVSEMLGEAAEAADDRRKAGGPKWSDFKAPREDNARVVMPPVMPDKATPLPRAIPAR